jgi:hypothetical protein
MFKQKLAHGYAEQHYSQQPRGKNNQKISIKCLKDK